MEDPLQDIVSSQTSIHSFSVYVFITPDCSDAMDKAILGEAGMWSTLPRETQDGSLGPRSPAETRMPWWLNLQCFCLLLLPRDHLMTPKCQFMVHHHSTVTS